MELELPDKNGIELLMYFKMKNANCKAIVFTQNTNQFYLDLALRSGADYFVMKGKDENRLKCILSELSGNRFYTRDLKNSC